MLRHACFENDDEGICEINKMDNECKMLLQPVFMKKYLYICIKYFLYQKLENIPICFFRKRLAGASYLWMRSYLIHGSLEVGGGTRKKLKLKLKFKVYSSAFVSLRTNKQKQVAAIVPFTTQ